MAENLIRKISQMDDAGFAQAQDQIEISRGGSTLRAGLYTGTLARLASPTVDESPTIIPLNYIGGVLYGQRLSDQEVMSSSNEGSSWSSVVAGPGGTPAEIRLIYPTTDGEVVAVTPNRIFKSSGWPSSVTWVEKVSATGDNGRFVQYSVTSDAAGQRFIAAEYAINLDWADSRYVWISTDAGETFNVVWDANAEYPAEIADTHFHAAAYDEQLGRFWFTEGHGTPMGFYYSDNDGASWTKIDWYLSPEATPTVAVATRNGLVLGSDGNSNGIHILPKTGQAPQEADVYWALDVNPNNGLAIAHFGSCFFYDKNRDLAFVGFTSEDEGNPFVVAVSDGANARLLYVSSGISSAGAGDKVRNIAVSSSGKIFISLARDAGAVVISGQLIYNAPLVERDFDPGGALRGTRASSQISCAVGTNARAGDFSLAAGASTEAGIDGNTQVSLGYNITSVGNGNISVGTGIVNQGGIILGTNVELTTGASGSVIVGRFVTPTVGDIDQTALGESTQTKRRSTAVGKIAKALSNNSVALGYDATAAASLTSLIAIGDASRANHSRSVALGSSATTQATDQVCVGDRDVEITDAARGAILRDTNGVRYRITVSTAGELVVTSL